jgi:hypothetical protein
MDALITPESKSVVSARFGEFAGDSLDCRVALKSASQQGRDLGNDGFSLLIRSHTPPGGYVGLR